MRATRPLVTAILKGDGVAKPSFKQVVLNTDVIDALSKNRIQYTAVFGGIDDVTAALQGVKLRTFPYSKYLGAAGTYPNAVFVASDKTIASRGPALRGALTALAEGYEFAAKHPAAAEAILIKDNQTALGKSKQIVVATGNATAKTFVDAAGRWGPLSTRDFAGLEAILAKGGVVKGHASGAARPLHQRAPARELTPRSTTSSCSESRGACAPRLLGPDAPAS